MGTVLPEEKCILSIGKDEERAEDFEVTQSESARAACVDASLGHAEKSECVRACRGTDGRGESKYRERERLCVRKRGAIAERSGRETHTERQIK